MSGTSISRADRSGGCARGEPDWTALGDELERLYERYNDSAYLSPDPVEFLHGYDDVRDREIVGLVASGLAYGRVAQINRSVARALERLGPSPWRRVVEASVDDLRSSFASFRHRFTCGDEMAALLVGAGRMLRADGSLGARFAELIDDGDETVVPALTRFVGELRGDGPERSSVLPDPCRKSACKRLHLYLRWMVRSDRIDPGGWDAVPRSKLVVPLDTHMHRYARSRGLTGRRQADLRTALEITEAFRRIRPDDPVRYDFAITRLGILKLEST
jgi:uncharacterized protein (TIGR02757 family)